MDRLTPRQLEIVTSAVRWASQHPDGIAILDLPIVDPADFDGLTLGRVQVDSLGYTTWVTE